MQPELQHAMRPSPTAAERARQNFVGGLRSFVLNEMAADMRHAYEARVRPRFARSKGRAPTSGPEVHKAMRGDPAFALYSALRVNAQRLVWDSVVPVVERERDRYEAASASAPSGGSLTLDPTMKVPRNVDGIDVHLMPGGYVRGDTPRDPTVGAIYDQGLAVFSFGLMGANLDDIGRSIARYVHRRYPDFAPRAILDVGCTIGHNTVPWAKTFPDAEVHAVDVAPGGLVYGHARARMQGAAIHFKQMDATSLSYLDASFDVVFSSMFLHEISRNDTAAFFREAHRVLRPGGLMLHMELPPNEQMNPYDGFYLDWDCYYNEEPFYKAFRDQNPKALCTEAGFDESDYLQFVVPSEGFYGADEIDRAVAGEGREVDDTRTGRLADGIQWFAFGAWKR